MVRKNLAALAALLLSIGSAEAGAITTVDITYHVTAIGRRRRSAHSRTEVFAHR